MLELDQPLLPYRGTCQESTFFVFVRQFPDLFRFIKPKQQYNSLVLVSATFSCA